MATTSNNNSNNTIEPKDNDIKAGRGNGSNRHPGNIYFRSIIEAYKEKYTAETTSVNEKKDIILKINQQIESLNPPGRFLKKDATTGMWSVMTKKQKERKTGQALREKPRKDDDENEDDRKEGEARVVEIAPRTVIPTKLADTTNFGGTLGDLNYDNITHKDNNSCANKDAVEVLVRQQQEQQQHLKKKFHGTDNSAELNRSFNWDDLVTTDDHNASTTECYEESVVDLMASMKSMEFENSKADLMDVSQNICGYLGLSERAIASTQHARRQPFPVVTSPTRAISNELFSNLRHSASPYYNHQEEGIEDNRAVPTRAISNDIYNKIRHSAPPFHQHKEHIKDSPTDASHRQTFCTTTFNNKQDAALTQYPPFPSQDIKEQQQNCPTQSSHPIHNDNNLNGASTLTSLEGCTAFIPRRQTFPIPSNLNFNPDVFFSEQSNNNTSESSLNLSNNNNSAMALLYNDKFDESMSFNESIAKIDFGLDSMQSISYGNTDEGATS